MKQINQRAGMAARTKTSPSLSPKQMEALLRQRKQETEIAFFEAARGGEMTWEDVADEFLTGYEAPRFMCLQEPIYDQTIGHIAAEEEDETLWAILLDVGEEHREAFARMLATCDRHGKTVEQRIRLSDCVNLQMMLDVYLGVSSLD